MQTLLLFLPGILVRYGLRADHQGSFDTGTPSRSEAIKKHPPKCGWMADAPVIAPHGGGIIVRRY
jgi:hypothetical protein